MNKNLVCLKHPHYQGSEHPELSCKSCCYLFVEKIKADRMAGILEDEKTAPKLRATNLVNDISISLI